MFQYLLRFVECLPMFEANLGPFYEVFAQFSVLLRYLMHRSLGNLVFSAIYPQDLVLSQLQDIPNPPYTVNYGLFIKHQN